MATSFFGSLLIAWRRQVPIRAPGKSVRRLLVVLSNPSVKPPPDPIGRLLVDRCALELLIRLGQGCRTGVRPYSRDARCTRPGTIVGRYTVSVRQWLCFSSARK